MFVETKKEVWTSAWIVRVDVFWKEIQLNRLWHWYDVPYLHQRQNLGDWTLWLQSSIPPQKQNNDIEKFESCCPYTLKTTPIYTIPPIVVDVRNGSPEAILPGDYGRRVGYPPGNDHISPEKSILKMMFLFPRWDMLVPSRVFVSDETRYWWFFWRTSMCRPWWWIWSQMPVWWDQWMRLGEVGNVGRRKCSGGWIGRRW